VLRVWPATLLVSVPKFVPLIAHVKTLTCFVILTRFQTTPANKDNAFIRTIVWDLLSAHGKKIIVLLLLGHALLMSTACKVKFVLSAQANVWRLAPLIVTVSVVKYAMTNTIVKCLQIAVKMIPIVTKVKSAT